MKTTILVVLALCANNLLVVCRAFAPSAISNRPATQLAASGGKEKRGFLQGVSDFFQELDNFIDDASARRLGNGAAFYGKRKSSFYGKNDKYRKVDAQTPDPMEDYQAPSTGGYFQWMPDEDGQMRPVTRMKNKVVERNPNFWDKVYEKDEN